MKKEELEKDVEEYLENEHCENVCTHSEIEECKEGIRIRCMSFNCRKELIVNFAEPREKQIQIDAEQIRALQKQNGELTDKVRELEDKVNNYLFNYTKLERKYKSRCDKFNELDNLYEKLILKNKELEAQVEKMKCCPNCDFIFRDGNCYYDKECKNKDHWKLRR